VLAGHRPGWSEGSARIGHYGPVESAASILWGKSNFLSQTRRLIRKDYEDNLDRKIEISLVGYIPRGYVNSSVDLPIRLPVMPHVRASCPGEREGVSSLVICKRRLSNRMGRCTKGELVRVVRHGVHKSRRLGLSHVTCQT